MFGTLFCDGPFEIQNFRVENPLFNGPAHIWLACLHATPINLLQNSVNGDETIPKTIRGHNGFRFRALTSPQRAL